MSEIFKKYQYVFWVGAFIVGLLALSPRPRGEKRLCPAVSLQRAERLRAVNRMVALQIPDTPHLADPLSFVAFGDEKQTLADFAGRALLLNLWAPWCPPCRAEMPALDHLQAQGLQVVAVNVDFDHDDKAAQFFERLKIKHLARYRGAIPVEGLPESFLIDAQGCELGKLAGGSDWDSPAALALVKALQD